MAYNDYEGSIGEGVLVWFLFNLGIIPVLIYLIYLMASGRPRSSTWGYIGKKSGLTWLLLTLIELIIVIIVLCCIYL